MLTEYGYSKNREREMKGHKETVSSFIQLEDGRIYSCSDDKTIRRWNIESSQSEITIHGHTSRLCCITQWMDGRLCRNSGLYDNAINYGAKILEHVALLLTLVFKLTG
jgi:WD40 repeat protein